MYQAIILLGAIIATIAWFKFKNLIVKRLVFILWGATIMFTVDSILTYYLEGENPIEISLNTGILGITLIILAIIIAIFLKHFD
ncbi:MAG: hypothetical protein QXR02_00050 [Acidilobaceae archaeon]